MIFRVGMGTHVSPGGLRPWLHSHQKVITVPLLCPRSRATHRLDAGSHQRAPVHAFQQARQRAEVCPLGPEPQLWFVRPY